MSGRRSPLNGLRLVFLTILKKLNSCSLDKLYFLISEFLHFDHIRISYSKDPNIDENADGYARSLLSLLEKYNIGNFRKDVRKKS